MPTEWEERESEIDEHEGLHYEWDELEDDIGSMLSKTWQVVESIVSLSDATNQKGDDAWFVEQLGCDVWNIRKAKQDHCLIHCTVLKRSEIL